MILPDYLTPVDDGAVLEAFVQPRATRTAVVGMHGSALKIKVAAPPVDGKANDALRAFVADALGLPRSRVELIAGAGSRHKRLRITGVAPEKVAATLRPQS
jgi:uncharacterized protein (TIGR00251 family)